MANYMLEANIRDNQELSQLIQQANSKREAIALVQEVCQIWDANHINQL
ncbi:MAG: hypothetical protein V7K97_19085 [Nostoc sp.]